MKNANNKLVVTDRGPDLLEYALLIALIALVAVGATTAAGYTLGDLLHLLHLR